MGSKKNVDMTQTDTEVKIVETTEKADATTEGKVVDKKPAKAKKVRGKRYQAVRSQLDKSKFYNVKEATELVKKLSYTKFVGSVEAHAVVGEIADNVSLALPHSTGQTVKVTIVDAKVLSDIEAGKLDFDILIAHPEFMPKLAKFAAVLGPKGLMPNPKSGTLTDKPEEAVARLSVAKTMIKTEKKAPIIHIVVGKVSQSEEELSANIGELIRVISPAKIKKLAICATMGPSVKIEVIK